MQFLRILFWCLLAFVAAMFAFGNWIWVSILLPGNVEAQINLPLLLLLVFLLGFAPTLAYQHVIRWRLRQRLASAERQLAELRALPVQSATPAALVPRPVLDPGDRIVPAPVDPVPQPPSAPGQLL